MIEFEGVTKVLPDGSAVLEDVSLVAATGAVTALLAPNGAVVSTALRLVNRLVDPSAGRILLDGSPNTDVRRSQLRRGIGYLTGSVGLFPHRNVLENITAVPRLLGRDGDASRTRATELLTRVGLAPAVADRYPGALSAGQAQRVGLARALAADPPVLLLDEPYAPLEPRIRDRLVDDLIALQAELGKTILLATRDVEVAVRLADTVAVFTRGGRLVQVAPPQRLLSQPADDDVAELVGRERGMRALAFVPAAGLPLGQVGTVGVGATGSRAKAIADSSGGSWLLVVDDDGSPRGWVDAQGLDVDATVSGTAVRALGATFYPDESLRDALDAAVLSVAGLAVCIDDDGRLVGTVSHADIARYITVHRTDTDPAPHLSSDPPRTGVEPDRGDDPSADAVTVDPGRGAGEPSGTGLSGYERPERKFAEPEGPARERSVPDRPERERSGYERPDPMATDRKATGGDEPTGRAAGGEEADGGEEAAGRPRSGPSKDVSA